VSNKYKILLNQTNQNLSFPLEIKWDYNGYEDSLIEYQTEIISEVVGKPKDFEVFRFSHAPSGNSNSINYNFYFYNGGYSPSYTTFINSNQSSWSKSYLSAGFSVSDLYYNRRSFNKSFFKIDFYDSPNDSIQKIYFSVIIPTTQGKTIKTTISEILNQVNIRTPDFKLDYVGDKEGFNLFWLRDRNYLNIDTFYMSAKFFSAKDGQFIRMMNTGQYESPIKDGNWWNFDKSKYFYNKVVLNYDSHTYEVFNSEDIRIGVEGNPLKWYEYINPIPQVSVI
jgi:hypothetical protein